MKYNGRDITTIWLDLDDTIIDFMTNARTALRELYYREPVLQTHFADPDLWSERYEASNHQLWDAYSRAEITREFLRMERFRHPLTEAGIENDTALTLAQRYDTLYLDLLAEGRALMPGAMHLLESLKDIQGITLAILSNGFREVQFRKINNCGLKDYFHTVVLSDDIGFNKPDRRLFDYAMQQVNDPDPTHHLMIGDNPATDIAGAISAGWNAIWYHPEIAFRGVAVPSGASEFTDLNSLTDALIHH